jgi:hypothetical protein
MEKGGLADAPSRSCNVVALDQEKLITKAQNSERPDGKVCGVETKQNKILTFCIVLNKGANLCLSSMHKRTTSILNPGVKQLRRLRIGSAQIFDQELRDRLSGKFRIVLLFRVSDDQQAAQSHSSDTSSPLRNTKSTGPLRRP